MFKSDTDSDLLNSNGARVLVSIRNGRPHFGNLPVADAATRHRDLSETALLPPPPLPPPPPYEQLDDAPLLFDERRASATTVPRCGVSRTASPAGGGKAAGVMASSLKKLGGPPGSLAPLALLMLHSRRWALLVLLVGLSLALYLLLPAGAICGPPPDLVAAGKGGLDDATLLLHARYRPPERFVTDSNGGRMEYNNEMPLIFVGGMPRSGTTLIRVLLDAHPDIRCGEETRIIPRLLSMKQQWTKNPVEMNRLIEGGITNEVIDRAVSSFILEVIVRHGKPAARLCNKDPFTLRAATYLHQLFPKAKFLLMIRDGRAVVHSIITRKVTITGYDLTSYRQCLKKWNQAMTSMYAQCQQLGEQWCLPVYYEQLVLHPRPWLEKILTFLDVAWSDDVLRHDQLVNKPGGISLSMLERSTDQVIKPINMDALSKWVGAIPKDVIVDMAQIAPMLEYLGYDPHANPPDYGKPDSFVVNNTAQIKLNVDEWRAREHDVEREREALKRKMAEAKNNNNHLKEP